MKKRVDPALLEQAKTEILRYLSHQKMFCNELLAAVSTGPITVKQALRELVAEGLIVKPRNAWDGLPYEITPEGRAACQS
jgi:DNA-binding HxlR family transcriptional regulator